MPRNVKVMPKGRDKVHGLSVKQISELRNLWIWRAYTIPELARFYKVTDGVCNMLISKEWSGRVPVISQPIPIPKGLGKPKHWNRHENYAPTYYNRGVATYYE